jgi:hypothetical protein
VSERASSGDVPRDPFEVRTGLGVSGAAISTTWAWLAVGIALVLVGASVAIGFVTPAILLDLVASWPVAALGVAAIPVAFAFRARWPVLVAVVPLLFLTWVLVGVGWFLTDGISEPPSRAGDIAGPDTDPDLATFVVELDGRLVVTDAVGLDYELTTSRTGGDTSPPEVYESVGTGRVDALARPRGHTGWYESSGWQLGLRSGPVWTLDVTAAEIDADLTTVTVAAMTVDADGMIRLGRGAGTVSVSAGTLTIVIPSGMPASVSGASSVPDGWAVAGGVATAPAGADGLAIEVAEGADVTVVEDVS